MGHEEQDEAPDQIGLKLRFVPFEEGGHDYEDYCIYLILRVSLSDTHHWKEVKIMPGIVIRDGDSFEAALKRFKKQVEKAGVLAEVRKREAFEKPSVKRKKKDIAARKNRSKRGFSRPKRKEY